MKSYFTTFLFLFAIIQLQAQVIEFNDPDFKKMLLTQTCIDNDLDGEAETRADINEDEEIDVSEAAQILGIVFTDWPRINNINDLQHFTNLISFSNADSKVPADKYDFRANSKLKNLELFTNEKRVNFSNYNTLQN